MSLVSIIVPVYNVEKYLPICIESVLNQSVTDFELILVDDGSTDASPGICDDYEKKDSRIRVIHQKNAGVSSARNAGLDAAQGEYIAFVDSDDWIDRLFLEQCLSAVHSNNCDLCIVGFHFYNNTVVNTLKMVQRNINSSCMTSVQLKELMKKCLITNIWSKLYRRDIIGDLRFDTSMNFGEDLCFCFEILKKDISIAVLDWAGYYYRITLDGLTSNRVNERKCKSVVKTYQFLYEYANTNGFIQCEEYMTFLDNRWSQDYFSVADSILGSKMKFVEKKQMLGILTTDQKLCYRINCANFAQVSDPTNIFQLYRRFYIIWFETLWQDIIIKLKRIIKKMLLYKQC